MARPRACLLPNYTEEQTLKLAEKPVLVIKIGGNVLDNQSALHAFLNLLAKETRYDIALVHGGGKIATEIAARLGIETVMEGGRRITTASMLDVVTMVYGGLVNKQLVAYLCHAGKTAVGITGADADCIRSEKRPVTTVDYGFVGDIVHTNDEFLLQILAHGFMPVIAPLTHDGKGTMLNTNADTIASAVATALAKTRDTRLWYCFEKKGVLADPTNDDSVIESITPSQAKRMVESGAIAKGMLPKLENAFYALQNGVKHVRITSAEEIASALAGAVTGTNILLDK